MHYILIKKNLTKEGEQERLTIGEIDTLSLLDYDNPSLFLSLSIYIYLCV